MMYFVTIFESETGAIAGAIPLISTPDAAIVAATAAAFCKKLGGRTPGEVRRLTIRLAPEPAPEPALAPTSEPVPRRTPAPKEPAAS
jgi:hypothetical protein